MRCEVFSVFIFFLIPSVIISNIRSFYPTFPLTLIRVKKMSNKKTCMVAVVAQGYACKARLKYSYVCVPLAWCSKTFSYARHTKISLRNAVYVSKGTDKANLSRYGTFFANLSFKKTMQRKNYKCAIY